MKRIFVWIVHRLLNGVIRLRHKISLDLESIDFSEGPFVFLGNHVNNWDPFYINIPINTPISYVASERFFKTWPLGFVLNFFDAVPKMKFKSDLMTIRRLLKRKQAGLHIGVFPEGRRSWDGRTVEVVYATSKLIKMLKMPVVVVESNGAYLSEPRWADHYRRGRIHLKYTRILTEEQVRSMSVDEIHAAVVLGLSHNEDQWQDNRQTPYRGKRLAERIERLLFMCPECKTLDSLRSSNDMLTCGSCGYQVRLDEYGRFNLINGKKNHYNSPADWSSWQLEELKTHLEIHLGTEVFAKNAQVIYYDKSRKVLRSFHDKVCLEHERIYVEEWIDLNRLSGINIQSNDKIEFYIDEQLVRVVFDEIAESVYKWQHALKYIIGE
jgi:1-acyl-sn-glycerol-3-phosphate acyltransferase